VIRDTDAAIWERIRLIPFVVQIPPAERDKTLEATLLTELPGILRWAVEGCLAWLQRTDLGEPGAVVEATAAYQKEMDTLQQFLDACCLWSPKIRVKAGTFYKAYQAWCEEQGTKADSLKEIGLRLEHMPVEKKTSNGVWYLGLGLHSTTEE
jgi:putative DNA primase/helicase